MEFEVPRIDSAIWASFRTGDTTLLKDALNQGADIDFVRTESDGTTPLMAAAYCGDESVVHKLLHLRADPTIRDYAGYTASNIASLSGHINLAVLLYEAEEERKREIRDDSLNLSDLIDIDTTGVNFPEVIVDTQGEELLDTIPVVHYENCGDKVNIRYDQDPLACSNVEPNSDAYLEFDRDSDTKDDDSDINVGDADYWDHCKDQFIDEGPPRAMGFDPIEISDPNDYLDVDQDVYIEPFDHAKPESSV